MPLPPPAELFEPVALCGPDGRLNPAARGWSRWPILRCGIARPFLRRKRWNFVFVSHPDVLVAAALSDADYAGLSFLWLYDLKRQRFLELEHLSPLGVGVKLGATVDEAAEFRSRAIHYSWQPCALPGGGRGIDISVAAPRMKGSASPLSLKLRIVRERADGKQDEGLNLVVPWSDTRFNYTGKLVALVAEGELEAGGERYTLNAADTLASIDCTRGIWPYATSWRWASAAGHAGPKKRRVGLNFGAGWTDGTGVVENALFFDGRVIPLWEEVAFSMQPARLDEPWTLRTTASQRVDLTFTPNYSRAQHTNLLVVQMRLWQVMGHYSGKIVLDNGESLELEGIPGIAENHMARW